MKQLLITCESKNAENGDRVDEYNENPQNTIL
jgi:hypothetical protein